MWGLLCLCPNNMAYKSKMHANWRDFLQFSLLSNKLNWDKEKYCFLLDLTPYRGMFTKTTNLKIHRNQRASLFVSQGIENSSLCFGRSTNNVCWWSQEALRAQSLSSLETWHEDLSHDFTHCQERVISSQFTHYFIHSVTLYHEREQAIKF